MNVLKKILILVVLCAIMLISVSAKDDISDRLESIQGIHSEYFLDELNGTYYIYFGRPTCTECIAFENVLQEYLVGKKITIHYYNTQYWKDEDQNYEHVLALYDIQYVPLLVKIVNGEEVGRFSYQIEDNPSCVNTKLDELFLPISDKTLSVSTEDGHPLQFADKLLAVTFFALIFNLTVLLCWRVKKKNIETRTLFLCAVNATWIGLLHIMISSFSFSYTLYYDAIPDSSFLGILGRKTWLVITPIIYCFIIYLCGYLISKNKES